MIEEPIRFLTRERLAQKLSAGALDNFDPLEGFALVNVHDVETFEHEHIPGSINIPMGHEDEFERRFDKGKEIIVYCTSSDCDAAPLVARELARRGFHNVFEYEAGLNDWKQAELPTCGLIA